MLKLTEKEVLAIGMLATRENTPLVITKMLDVAQSAYEKILADQLPPPKARK